MGFKMGMFSYFNSVDLDGSGFLEEDEVACKLLCIEHENRTSNRTSNRTYKDKKNKKCRLKRECLLVFR